MLNLAIDCIGIVSLILFRLSIHTHVIVMSRDAYTHGGGNSAHGTSLFMVMMHKVCIHMCFYLYCCS